MHSLSQFQSLLKPITQSGQFTRYVRASNADKHQKTLKTHDLLIHLLFAQISKSTSLRILEERFNSHPTHHYHLNTRPVRRSTLSDALQKRDIAPFIALAGEFSAHHARKIRTESQDILALLDSTTIALNPDLFTFARSNSHNQGLKLHLLIDAKQQQPLYFDFSSSTSNDIQNARHMPIETGYHYVFDRGYCDYRWWQHIHRQGASFTTRLRKGTRYQIIEEKALDAQHPHILEDQTIRLHKAPDMLLRRIVVKRDHKAPLELVSNRLQDAAHSLAEAYKARWGIELLFKWVKQHLNLKNFLGRSANAVKLQILAALIVWFLLNIYKERHGLTDSLHLLFARLSGSLFTRTATPYCVYRKRRREREERLQKQSDWLGGF